MQKQPASPKALKLAQVAFAAASCLLVAGVIFGFAALKPVLVHEGIYDELCDTKRDAGQARRTGRPCLGQDLQLNLSFTISVIATNVGALPVGVILDNVGPKYTSLLGAMLFALGNFSLGLDPHASGFDTFLVGYVLLAIGGPMVFLSSFHLCNTFPSHSGLILSTIIGAFDASSLPFVVYAAMYRKHPVPLRSWFWIYLIVPIAIILWQATLGPKKPYVRGSDDASSAPLNDPNERTALLSSGGTADTDERDPSESMLRPGGMAELHRRPSVYDSSFSRIYDHIDTYDPTSGGTKARRGSRDGDDHRALPDPITGVLWGQSAFQQICTLWFWLPQLFLICYMLRINYEIATVYDQVYYYTSDADLAQKITDAFVILLPLGGVIAIPFIGFLLDKRSSMAAFVALLVLGLGYGILCMLDSVPAQLLGILMFTIMRPLMYTAISDYYTKVIGIETFGTVYGFANAMSGAFTIVQYAIDYTVKKKLHGNYTPVNFALVLLGAGLAISVIAKQYFGAHKQSAEVSFDSVEEN